MSEFDRARAEETFRRGLAERGTSTLTWGFDVWAEEWRSRRRGVLGGSGGAWWFRALTDPVRLDHDVPDVSTAALTTDEARRRLREFMEIADERLRHWPKSALAPVAFPLTEAVGDEPAFGVLSDVLATDALPAYLRWFPEVPVDVARQWVERLTDAGALDAAEEFVELLGLEGEATWRLDHRRDIPLRLLRDAADRGSDELFEELARKSLPRRDRAVWDVLCVRPIAGLVDRMLDRVHDPVAPWVVEWFREADADVVDALLDRALGRSSYREDARAMLGEVDATLLRVRVGEHDDEAANELLGSIGEDLPELARSEQPRWMDAAAEREPGGERWLDPAALPPLVTRSGHRLPRAVTRGIVAMLQEVTLREKRYGELDDRFDGSLLELAGVLDREAADRWWNALFAQWWTAGDFEESWPLTAVAFVCSGHGVRDVARKLHHHEKWFGPHGTVVVRAIARNHSAWAIVTLDDLARRSRNAEHRDLARRLLRHAADRAQQTVDAYVESNLPDEDDPELVDVVARRVEEAMVEGRAWTGWSWRRLVEVATPFSAVARALLWSARDPQFGDERMFRFDGVDLLDSDDEPVVVDDDDDVGVVHPAALDDADRETWNERFVDYEIVQPFDQLGRRRFRRDSLSRDGFRSPVGQRFDGPRLLRAARQRGWREIRQGAHGRIVGLHRKYAPDVVAVLELTEPLAESGAGESQIAAFRFETSRAAPLDDASVPAASFSEAHRDVMELLEYLG